MPPFASIITKSYARIFAAFFLKGLWGIGLMFCCQQGIAQSADTITVPQVLTDTVPKIVLDSVKVVGNKRTRKYIILREMKIKPGDSIPSVHLLDKLRESQELIYNSNLFSDVTLTPVFTTARRMNIVVTVKERWYIYPSPQFQITDRNYNEWINTYNASLNRVVYGIKFAHYNVSGRRDQLRIYVLNGFARNFSASYSSPYSNRKLTEGFSVLAGFTQSRDVTYKTSSHNKPIRYSIPNRGFVRSHFNMGASYLRRKGYFRRHLFSLVLQHYNVVDSITSFYNPQYYSNGNRSHLSVPDMSYTFQYQRTNNINYPLTGQNWGLQLHKRGLGWSGKANMLQLTAGYNRYYALGKHWYQALNFTGNMKLPFKQPYINQTGMGYGEYYLRGLEDYVIDGVMSGIAKYTLRKRVIRFDIPVPFKNSIVSKIPFQIYAKAYGDAGYMYQKYGAATRLGNKMLYSGGAGIDLLSLYDTNISLEYSFNQLGQKGLFLHLKGGF